MNVRLLIVPSYEYPNINADSSYTLMRAWMVNALEADPNLFMYWLLPKESPNRRMYRWKYVDEWSHPRVEKHYVPTIKGRDLNEMLFGEELFELINPYNGKIPYWDAVLTNNAGKAARIVRLTEYMGRPKPPVFIWEFSPKLTKHTENNLDHSEMALYENYGANANDNCMTFFPSTWLYKRVVVGARDYLSSMSVRKLMANSKVIPAAIDLTRMDAVAKKLNGKKFPKLTLYFGGRFTTQKRADLVAEIYDYAYCLGKPVDVIVTTPTTQNARAAETKQEAAEIKFMEGLSQAEAWEVMLQSHVVLTAYKSFSFLPSAVMEQIAAGMVVLVFDRHVDDALGPGKYPFLYSSKEEALAILKKVVADLPAAQELMKPFTAYVRETYDFRLKAPIMLQIMKERAARDCSRLFPKKIIRRDMWGELAADVAGLPNRDWDTVFEFAAKKIPTLKATYDMPLMPGVRRTYWQLYKHLAARLGDDYTQSKPTFGTVLRTVEGDADEDNEVEVEAMP